MAMIDNFYEFIKNNSEDNEIVLDIGCGKFTNLMKFERDFDKLVGIEKKNVGFFNYFACKTIPQHYDFFGKIISQEELEKYYYEKFQIHALTDFTKFQFPNFHYSFLICNSVIHFYSDIEKFKWIEVFYNSLKKGGLLYLQINSVNHPLIEKATKLGNNIYEWYQDEEKVIWYLIETDEFINSLDKYNVIKKKVSNAEIAVVIKKPL